MEEDRGLPESRIIRIPTKDNFWAMGDAGPCGPCSEIFYDHGDHIPGGPAGSPDEDGDRFVEIWNLVFMQYEQAAQIVPICPSPSIDTGMGLERVAAVLQGVHDNYDTDTFKALIDASSRADRQQRRADMAQATASSPITCALRASWCGWRAARQRRPRLRPSPHHAPCDATCPYARRRRAPDAPAGAGLVAEMGAAYPELVRAAADRGDAEAGGNRFRRRWRRSSSCWMRHRGHAKPAGRSPARPRSSSTTPMASLRSDRGRLRARAWRSTAKASSGHGRAEGGRPRRLEGIGRKGSEISGSTLPKSTDAPNSPAIPAMRARAGPGHRQGRAARRPREIGEKCDIVSTRRPSTAKAADRWATPEN